MKKIAILTSGGDAPGMNPAIRAVVRTALAKEIEVYGIYDGYYGLYHDNIKQLTRKDVMGIMSDGGTILGSARFPEFAQEEVRKKAITNLEKHGIEGLVVIGGNGSYMGAVRLSEMGYPCIGIPGTIDNDAPLTDSTIGFDTALNTIVEAVDKLRDTSTSHGRCSVVEVMGRDAGDLALYAGIAAGADFTIIPEIEAPVSSIIEQIKKQQERGKKHFIIIVAEGVKKSQEICDTIIKETGVDTRLTILGHVQRGGSPSGIDRVLAARMGAYSVELLMNGESARCVGIINNHLVNNDILEAIDVPHKIDSDLYQLANKLLTY